MDSFDIFKKLTRGVKFKRNSTNVRPNKRIIHNSTNETLSPLIKEEKLDLDSTSEEDETKHESDNKTTDENVESLTLLGNITSDKRRLKRKRPSKLSEAERSRTVHEQEVNRTRNQLRLNVTGKNVPEPIALFDQLSVDTDLIENLSQAGYDEPTTVQKQAITVMLEGRQLLACAPTGSGKTAAFLVPVIHHLKGPQRKGFRAVIVCPTRELAKQTQRECVRLSFGRGFRIHIIHKKALTQYAPNSSQKFDILVTTPNRLCYLLKQEPLVISLANVEWLIIDEADKLFETGLNSFRDQLEEILQACSNKNRKIGMFSATLTPSVGEWCKENMRDFIQIIVGQKNSATDLVDQQLLFVGNEAGKLLAFREIVRNGIQPPVLIFVQSKDRAQQLFSELIFDGINVDAIHSDRTQTQRDNTVRCFREGKIWVLICTELMARGIDFKGVNLVVNYDFPTSAISYIHRVGRAGRAGRSGKAITFFTLEDTVNLRTIAHVIRQSGCEVPEYMLTIKRRSKRKLKKLKSRAPRRDLINTTPAYQLEKISNKGRYVKLPKEKGKKKNVVINKNSE